MADRTTNVTNSFETALTADLVEGGTTIEVESTVGSPGIPFYLVIDPDVDGKREVVLVDGSKDADTFLLSGGSARGLDGTSNVAHDSGAVVGVYPIAAHWTDINDRVDAVDSDVSSHTHDGSDSTQVATADLTGHSQAAHEAIGLLAGPVGAVMQYAGASAPSKWLECNGAAVSRTTYADLFSAIGTTYGTGDGSTTFNVPDLRERFPIGASGTYARGSTGGAITHTHTIPQTTAGGGHSHTQGDSGTAGSHAHTNPTTDSGGSHTHDGTGLTTGEAGSHSHTNSNTKVAGSHSHTNPTTGSGGSHNHGASTGSAGSHSHGGATGSNSGAAGSTDDGGAFGIGNHAHSIGSDGSHDHSVSTATDHSHSVGSTSTSANHSHQTFDTGTATAHSHSVPTTASGGPHTHTQVDTGSGGSHAHTNPATASVADHAHNNPDADAGDNLPPYLSLLYIIFTGV